jgi:hypothetical protein
MSMLEEVLDRPGQFLENWKEIAVNFSQWCHHNHYRFTNGTSADLLRISRPYGVMPVLYDVPTTHTNKILLMLLSVWRWGLAGAEQYPEYCVKCDCLNNSYHLLFRCKNTEDIRRRFVVETGRDFDEDAIYQNGHSWAIARAFSSICSRLQTHAE